MDDEMQTSWKDKYDIYKHNKDEADKAIALKIIANSKIRDCKKNCEINGKRK